MSEHESDSADKYWIVRYRPALSMEAMDVCFRILSFIGTVLVIGVTIVLFFWGSHLSNFMVLLYPIGVAMWRTATYYRRHIKAFMKNEGLDSKEESSYIYSLYGEYAELLFTAGFMLGLYMVILFGKATRDAELSVDWLTIAATILLLLASDKLGRYSKRMLREEIGLPILALTWPTSAEAPLPMPTTPEREPVPVSRNLS